MTNIAKLTIRTEQEELQYTVGEKHPFSGKEVGKIQYNPGYIDFYGKSVPGSYGVFTKGGEIIAVATDSCHVLAEYK